MSLSQVGQFNLCSGFLYCGRTCKFERQEKQPKYRPQFLQNCTKFGLVSKQTMPYKDSFIFLSYFNIIYFIAYAHYKLQDFINPFANWQIQSRRWWKDTASSFLCSNDINVMKVDNYHRQLPRHQKYRRKDNLLWFHGILLASTFWNDFSI